MFFKKKAEALKTARAEARQQILDSFQSSIDAASAQQDPADKLEALQLARRDMSEVAQQQRGAAESVNFSKLAVPYLGLSGSTLGSTAFVALHFALSPAIMMLTFPAMYVGARIGAKSMEKARAANREEAEPFFEAIEEKQKFVSGQMEAVVRDHVQELASSPKFATLASNGSLQASFLEAMQQKLASPAPAAQPEPPRPAGGLNL